MMNELIKIIKRQRLEWDKKRATNYVPRLQLAKIAGELDSSLIKVITGPRRAGKSVLAAILLKDKNAAYLNFDEPFFARSVDTEDLLPALKSVYGEADVYFLDEVQNLDGWPLWLNRLQRDGLNVVVSGSNANLLSGEFATHLTGRFLATEVLPFSYREFVNFYREFARPDTFNDKAVLELGLTERFLRFGGYPEIVTTNLPDPAAYLSALVEATVSKDIVDRHHLRKSLELRNVAEWVFSNVSNELAFNRLSSPNSASGLPGSPATTKKFLGYIQEAYLVKLLTRYDQNHQERLKSPRKAYAIDNGVATAMGIRNSPDNGRLLENAVATELMKAGGDRRLEYFRSTQGDKEVDFVVRHGHVTEKLIEATWELKDGTMIKKKLASLIQAAKATGCRKLTIVTWLDEKTIEHSGLTVEVKPFYRWALGL